MLFLHFVDEQTTEDINNLPRLHHQEVTELGVKSRSWESQGLPLHFIMEQCNV